MAKDLGNEVQEQINELYQDQAWLTLLTVKNASEDVVTRLCINTEDVIFDGDTYLKSNVEVGEFKQATAGTIPSVTLNVQNVDRILGQLVESDPDFGSGWIIGLRVVHQKHLGSNPEYSIEDTLYDEFTVTEVNTTVKFVSFSLSVSKNPMRLQFPAVKFSPATCQRTFDNKLTGCPYSTEGKDGTSFSQCNKTIENCIERFDEDRSDGLGNKIGLPFLAFQGMSRRAIYKV